MTLKELYTRVASAIQGEGVAECLCNATFVSIDSNKLDFKTFIEVKESVTAKDLITEYDLPRYILLWKTTDSMWLIEGTETKTELKVILRAKTECKEVRKIILVDSTSEVIEIIRDVNMVSISEVLSKKSGIRKGRKTAILLPS